MKRKKYDCTNRPKLWLKKRLEWVAAEQGKHICRCGCRRPIQITLNHWRTGISGYLQGHHPSNRASKLGKFRNSTSDFWKLVDRKGDDDCWVWRGWVGKDGYGRFYFQGAKRISHRLGFYLIHGKWAKDTCHSCDNPPCCNPNHLFDGTRQENMDDAARKGRMSSKLDSKGVLGILDLIKKGKTRKSAASRFGVSEVCVDKIMDGTIWSHATGIPKKKRKRYNGQ